jgi:hypothetical protein
MRRKGWILVGIAAAVLAGAWFTLNPPGRFGFAVFGLTTYNSVLWPVTDLEVRADGSSRRVSKTHDLLLDDIAWLLESRPETLILTEGWRGAVHIREQLRRLAGLDVRVLRTPDALRLFNRLKRDGVRVAIHVHSTC